jgi:hypothetical protein
MFTCSGGDSNSGLGKNLHICHRSFYLDEENYVESILKQKGIENWDISLFNKGTIDFMRKYYMVDTEQKPEVTRFLYIMRNYHDFWRFQIGYIRAMMIELALAGQVDREYLKNENLNVLFALFANTGLSCPIENLLNTGVSHFTPLSLIRLFGNGAFQEILRVAGAIPQQ